MELVEIYTEAAKIYSDREHGAARSGCCMAIGYIEKSPEERKRGHYSSYESSEAQDQFADIFEPESAGGWWWTKPEGVGYEKDRKARVLALLFAAEVARTGL